MTDTIISSQPLNIDLNSENPINIDISNSIPINLDIVNNNTQMDIDIANQTPINVDITPSIAYNFSLQSTSNPTSFLNLVDTPDSYAGKSNNIVTVKSDETGLQFSAVANLVSWGQIGGTLANQTDLVSALNGKADKTITINGYPISSNVSLTKADISLGNVDNTSDALKPISTATQLALNAKANISGQVFTGNISAPNLSNTNTGDQDLSGYVPTSRTVNGHALSSDVTVTKSDVNLGNVVNLDTSTTTNITDSVNKRFVTDANLTVINNTSGVNTGNQDLSGLVPKTTQINGHALTSNVTLDKSDIGLSNVPNLDTSNPCNITQDATHRFATDLEKAAWNAKQNALGYTPEDVANKSTNTSLGNSNTLYPTQNAVKTYVDTIVGGSIILQGDWNATSNIPAIDGTTTTGYAWRVSVAGTYNLGGITSWEIGDLAVKSATGWIKIDNSDIGGVWGNITGTLSNQTDLVTFVNTKLNTSDFNSTFDSRLATKTTDNLTEGSTNKYDKTVSLSDGTGISTSGTYPSFTITNTSPDQVVAFTDGTGISTTGTYPSFTITNTAPDQTVSLSNGTGITTSGTYPSFTITNSAPDQTVSFTGGSNVTLSGTYPDFTVNDSSINSGDVPTYESDPLSLHTSDIPTYGLSNFSNDLGNYGGWITNISGQDLSTADNSTSAFITLGDVPATLLLNQTSPQSVTGGTPKFDDIKLVLPGTINRDGNGYITSIVKTGGRTITPTRNGSNFITSITDGTNTWTFTRNGSNLITSWTVT